jgi:hypothetical protein
MWMWMCGWCVDVNVDVDVGVWMCGWCVDVNVDVDVDVDVDVLLVCVGLPERQHMLKTAKTCGVPVDDNFSCV